MFSSKTIIEKLTAEVLINITSFLSVATILQFSLSSKAFSHLIKDELVFRRLTERDYRVTDKEPEQSWVDLYKQLRSSTVIEPQVEEHVTVTTTEVIQEQEIVATTTVEEAAATQVIEQQTEEIVQEETNAEPAAAALEEVAVEKEDVDMFTTEEETPAVVESNVIVEEVVKDEQPEQHIEQQTEQQDSTTETEVQAPTENTKNENSCPHLDQVSDSVNEIKRIIYKSGNPSLCDLCLSQTASYLNMSDTCHNEACRSCLDTPVDDEEHFPIRLELQTGDLYCFKCRESDGNPRKLGEQDSEKVISIVEYIKAPESDEDLDKRRKAEHQLYVQELRREDMSLKHYLVEKQWGRTWMLFRTREGSPLPGKITNQKLARINGTLDPNIRLPMDKFRPSPETHGDIVSERLWSYLVKAYGVQGRAYSEDDIIAPEYARLRVYVDDFKKSINLYP